MSVYKILDISIFPEAFYRIESVLVEGEKNNKNDIKYIFVDMLPYKNHRSASYNYIGRVYNGYKLIELYEKTPQIFYNKNIHKKIRIADIC